MNLTNFNNFISILKSYLVSLIKPIPVWGQLFVTRKCNLNCKYCAAKNNQSIDPTFEDICKRILKLKSLGCYRIGIMGGEPTLREDVTEIIKFCSKNNISTQMSTNGSLLLDPRRSINGKTLLDNLDAAGISCLILSLDSLTTNYDVSLKELPKVSEVLNALVNLRKKTGLLVMITCVVTPQNIDQVPKMLELCSSNGVILDTNFVCDDTIQKGRERSDTNQVYFSKRDAEKIEQITDFLIRKKKEGHIILEPVEYFLAIKKWINGTLEWNCDAGKYSLSIDIDGKVGICGELPYLNLNIMELSEDFYEKNIRPYRETCQIWCTKKCMPMCHFCSTFWRNNPIKFIQASLEILRRNPA